MRSPIRYKIANILLNSHIAKNKDNYRGDVPLKREVTVVMHPTAIAEIFAKKYKKLNKDSYEVSYDHPLETIRKTLSRHPDWFFYKDIDVTWGNRKKVVKSRFYGLGNTAFNYFKVWDVFAPIPIIIETLQKHDYIKGESKTSDFVISEDTAVAFLDVKNKILDKIDVVRKKVVSRGLLSDDIEVTKIPLTQVYKVLDDLEEEIRSQS